MTTIYKSAYAAGQKPMPTPAEPGLVRVRMELILTATLIVGDTLYFGDLPAGYVPVLWSIENDDADSAGTITTDVGILTADKTTVSADAADGGSKWLTASTELQAAGFIHSSGQSAALQTALARTPVAAVDRGVGMVVVAAGAGGVGAVIALHMTYQAAQ